MNLHALGCVTGRFQPVHAQHLELFEIALAHCRHVVVAITNPDAGARYEEPTSAHRHTAAANPFTFYERVRLIDAAVQERGWSGRISVVPFDLTSPAYWAGYVPLTACQFVRAYSAWERQKARRFQDVGYGVALIEGDAAARVSAGDIRDRMRAGSAGWQAQVAPATVALLLEMLAERSLAERG